MRFHKYHGLGNDYLVMGPQQVGRELAEDEIRLICHRNCGVGSDGILWGPVPSAQAEFGLRIFNPDGSEAEKSGNGLRIFSRYLFDQGLVAADPFRIETLGGLVSSRVHPGGKLQITIASDFSINMTGGVTRVGAGEIAREAFSVPPPLLGDAPG
jgi:diaminopimelate epimerase